jgi:hypothetical protein
MWKCQHCGEEIEEDFNVCWNCLYGKDGTPPSAPKPEVNRPLRKDQGLPSEGERLFSWVFCFIYLSVLVGGGTLFAFWLVHLIFKDIPMGLFFVSPVLVIWALPGAAKRTSIVLASTRGMSNAKRLKKILLTF